MKFILLIVIVLAVYFFLVRHAPVKPVAKEVTGKEAQPLSTGGQAQSSPGQSNFLKRPLDRTHEVLDQVKKRNGDDNF